MKLCRILGHKQVKHTQKDCFHNHGTIGKYTTRSISGRNWLISFLALISEAVREL